MIKFSRIASRLGWCLGLAFMFAPMFSPVFAQTTVTLPDTSQTTTLNATISEQARVQVPATVAFTVTNIANSTASSGQSITLSNIALDSATAQVKVSVQANAANFTPPVALATTWSASDVSWNAATWTNATGAAGTLSNSAYTQVATCTANVATCSTTALVFTLAGNSSIIRSGLHSLVITWKFEEIGG